MNNKSRLYKYLLNYYDITEYGLIPPQIFNEDNKERPTLKQRLDYDQRILVQCLKEKLLQQLVYVQTELYGCFAFPWTDKKGIPRLLINKFDSFQYNSKIINKGLTKPTIRQSSQIIKIVKKINNQFLIFSVEHQKLLDIWIISVYNANTRRSFSCKVLPTDFDKMNDSFFQRIARFINADS